MNAPQVVTELAARAALEAQQTLSSSNEYALALFENAAFPVMLEWASEVQRLNDAGRASSVIVGGDGYTAVITALEIVDMLARYDDEQLEQFREPVPRGFIRAITMIGDMIGIAAFGFVPFTPTAVRGEA